MENSAYVSPPPLPPAAHLSSSAVAAFQAACNNSTAGMNFQEALLSRMGRGHFGLTGADIKDHFAGLGLAAAAAAGGVRSGSGLEGFPAGLPLLSHLQPPFGLHPFDPRLPFSTAAGAFRPIFGNTAAVVSAANSSEAQSLLHKSFPSAFQSPNSHHNSTKTGKGSPPTLFSPGQNLYPRSSAGSPGSPSSSPPISSHRIKTDENSNTDRHNDSVSPASMDSNHLDDERVAKKLRLCSKDIGCCCPICGLPLRSSELESHYTQELDYLAKLSAALVVTQEHKNNKLISPSSSPNVKSQHSPGIASMEIAPRSRWDTFQRIQRNRQSRIRVKLSRRAGKRPDEILEEDDGCPRSPKNLEQLRHGGPQSSSTPAPHGQMSSNHDDEDIDIVGDDHAHNNNNNNRNSSMSSSDASRDLQLHVYGPPQFSEADVLACMVNVEEEEEDNRDVSGKAYDDGDYIKAETSSPCSEDDMDCEEGGRKRVDVDSDKEEVETLKAKLKKLESSSKCSKCMKSLQNPVVNIGCWHIQCEKCWLTSLGTKKCCSLCGVSTLPSDLRKVFL